MCELPDESNFRSWHRLNAPILFSSAAARAPRLKSSVEENSDSDYDSDSVSIGKLSGVKRKQPDDEFIILKVKRLKTDINDNPPDANDSPRPSTSGMSTVGSSEFEIPSPLISKFNTAISLASEPTEQPQPKPSTSKYMSSEQATEPPTINLVTSVKRKGSDLTTSNSKKPKYLPEKIVKRVTFACGKANTENMAALSVEPALNLNSV